MTDNVPDLRMLRAELDHALAVIAAVREACSDAGRADAPVPEAANYGDGLRDGGAIRSQTILRILESSPLTDHVRERS